MTLDALTGDPNQVLKICAPGQEPNVEKIKQENPGLDALEKLLKELESLDPNFKYISNF
jgi:hypothetical protein